MQTLRLGRTNLVVGRVGFGALPIQRISFEESARILRRAVEAGVTFFDTARSYSDSEEKLGAAFPGLREKLIIASKTTGGDEEGIRKQIKISLTNLRTDYLDIYQFHNPKTVPLPGDGTGRYETMLDLKASGAIRFIGLTAHSLDRALSAVGSGLYDSVQFPFSLLSDKRELELAVKAREAGVALLGMKALGGGMIRNIPAAFAFTWRYDNLLPLWGIQRMAELEQFLALGENPPAWDDAMQQEAEAEKASLGPSYCRGCGYCLPCPAKIEIPVTARMSLLLARSPWQRWTSPEWQEKMARVDECTHCEACKSRCPYGLDPSAMVAEHWKAYKSFLKEKGLEKRVS
jgi:predicted aldo/keto reductase-like oxidoreductase